MLTIDDIKAAVPGIHEAEFLGKPVWIKELNFDAQMAIASSGLSDAGQLKIMVARSLCSEDGTMLFESDDQGVELLGNLKGEQTLQIFEQVKTINGLGADSENS